MEHIVSISEDGIVSFLLEEVSTPIGHLTQDKEEEVLVISDLHPELGKWDSHLAVLAEQFGSVWAVWPSGKQGRTHIEYWVKGDRAVLSETISRLTQALTPSEAVEGGRILLSLRPSNLTNIAV